MLLGALAGVGIGLGLWFGLRAVREQPPAPAPVAEASAAADLDVDADAGVDVDAEPGLAPTVERSPADSGAALPVAGGLALEPPYSLEAAPGKFVLGQHHRFMVDIYPELPRHALDVEVRPGLRVERPVPSAGPGATRVDEVALFVFTRTDEGLSAQTALGGFSWPGGRGWLLGLRSARHEDRVLATPMAWPKGGSERTQVEASVATVEATSQFRVRSLLGSNSWALTVEPRRGGRAALVAPVMQALANEAVTQEVWLDGRPLPGTTAVLSFGRHTLFGARELWLTVPAVESLETAPVEVELAPLPREADVPPAKRSPEDGKTAFARKGGPAGAGELRCDRITAISSLVGLRGRAARVLRLELGAEPPLLLVESAWEGGQPPGSHRAMVMENLRMMVDDCRQHRRSLAVVRSRKVEALETTAGTWSGIRVDTSDLGFGGRR